MLYIRQNEAPRMGQWNFDEESKEYRMKCDAPFTVEGQQERFDAGDYIIMIHDEETGGMKYRGESAAEAPVVEEESEQEDEDPNKRKKRKTKTKDK